MVMITHLADANVNTPSGEHKQTRHKRNKHIIQLQAYACVSYPRCRRGGEHGGCGSAGVAGGCLGAGDNGECRGAGVRG